jgi:hypothetical protein
VPPGPPVDPAEIIHQASVLDDHPFGFSGGARGINDVGRISGLHSAVETLVTPLFNLIAVPIQTHYLKIEDGGSKIAILYSFGFTKDRLRSSILE